MTSSTKILKLGTRRSLLAWAQSSMVARKVENQTPGIQVELMGIDTQGDKILDKPLYQMDGKDFFTAELDLALLDGRVDFTVHSMKDLALDRPVGITLAAVPARELQHDVIIFHETVVDRLREGKEIRIGTSSPRRLTLLPSFLEKALPSKTKPLLKFVEIRGNVNTRISRVHEAESTDRKVDGVVLAFAGLERLSHDQKGVLELWKLLEQTKLMVLPIQECPSAPAQGALAIETLKTNAEVLTALQKLHHPPTQDEVKKEREILREWGGGCHLKLGASFIATPSGGKLIIAGEKPNGDWVNETRIFSEQAHSPGDFTKVEAADLFDFKKRELSPAEANILASSSIFFVAHSRALEFLGQPEASLLSKKRVWVSGSKSLFKLAAQGIWVEGSVESKGFEHFKTFQKKTLLRMKDKIAFLTHAESEITDSSTNRIATYSHQFREIPSKIADSSRLFWTSGLPFSTVWSTLNTPEKQAEFLKKIHASGEGKTADVIRAHGVEPIIL